MSRRKRSYGTALKGSLLSAVPAGEMSILEFQALPKAKREALISGDNGKRCCCPPPQRNRLGGCQPALTWADEAHTALKPICITCMKPLVSGTHRRRDQTHVIGLSKMRLDHVDLRDLKALACWSKPSPRSIRVSLIA